MWHTELSGVGFHPLALLTRSLIEGIAGMRWRQKWLAGLFLTIAASFGVFWLPFLLPPSPIQGVSAANEGGFSNRVAVIAAGILALCAVLLLQWLRPAVRLAGEDDCRPMTRGWVLTWTLITGVLSAGLVVLVYHAQARFSGDYGYFVQPMTKIAVDHRKLYSEVDFPYGPLLIYPPVWLRGLFSWWERPVEAAYCAVYVAEQVGGLLLLAYAMQVMPIRTGLRRAMFAVMAVFTISRSLGMNYTFFRFAAPLAIFIFCVRGRRLGIAIPLLLGGQMICLGISPEMGFSFGCGTVAYALIRGLRERRIWIAVAALPLAGTALFLLLAGRDYLNMLGLFAAGVYNFIVEPQPHILIYLISLLWLAPLALAAESQQQETNAALLYGIYAMGLSLLPVAFGRADPGHVFYNGLPILLLALVTVGTWRPPARWVWIGSLAVVVLFYQWVGFSPSLESARLVGLKLLGAVRHQRANTAPAAWAPHRAIDDAPAEADVDRLQAIVGDSGVFAPVGLSRVLEQDLRQRHIFHPGAYVEMRDVLDRRAEQKQIDEMDAAPWALLPAEPILMMETPENTQFLLGFPFPYRSRRPPYVSGLMLAAELQRNWRQVATINGFILYRRNW